MLFIVAAASTLASTRLLRSRTLGSNKKRTGFLFAADNKGRWRKRNLHSPSAKWESHSLDANSIHDVPTANPQHAPKYKAHHITVNFTI